MFPRTRHLSLSTAALMLLLASCAGTVSDKSTPNPPLLDLRRQAPISGDAEAGQSRAVVCAACHGTRGLAIAPNFPNLAGQSATYLYVQLKSFQGGQRQDPIMLGMVADLSDADMRNLAAWYASLPPKPRGKADITSRGGQLFRHGDPGRGIPPCQGCHGRNGRGPRVYPSDAPPPPWSTFPHLQGQSAMYVSKALHDFRSGARHGTSNAAIMHGVARTLSDADIQALASYIAAQ